MAGNWKMNLNHLEAIALVQKLAFALDDKDFDARRGRVLPPFTDIRSVQTLVDGDKLTARLRRAGPVARTTPAPTPARSPARCWPSSAAPTSSSVTPSAASTTTRTTRWSTPRSQAAFRHGLIPILCVGEGLEVRQAGDARRAHASPSSTARSTGVTAEQAAHHRDRLRAGLGDRHRRGGDPGGRAGGLRGDPHPAGRAVLRRPRRRRPDPLRRLGQGRQRRRRSWPSRTSTAPWSAARASTPTSSSGSSGSARRPQPS